MKEYISKMVEKALNLENFILKKEIQEKINLGYINSLEDVTIEYQTAENNIFTNSIAKLYKFYFFGNFPLRLHMNHEYKSEQNIYTVTPVWSSKVF